MPTDCWRDAGTIPARTIPAGTIPAGTRPGVGTPERGWTVAVTAQPVTTAQAAQLTTDAGNLATALVC